MAFVSSSNNNTNITNGAVNTAHGVSTASTQVNAAYSKNIDNLIDDGVQSSKKSRQQAQRSLRRSVPVETSTPIALVSCDGLGGYDWSDQAEEGPNYALMAFLFSSSDSKVSNDSTCLKSCLETVKLLKSKNDQLLKDLKKFELMVLVAPPHTRNFMPPTSDLSFTVLNEIVSKPVVENCKAKTSEEEPKVVRKNDDAPIIEEWVSDNEEEDVSQPKIEKKIVRPSIVKKKVNHQNFAKKTHPCAKKNMVPRVVLMKSGFVSVNNARQANAAHSKTTVNAARSMSYLSKIAHSTVKRPIQKNTAVKNSNINQRVNTVKSKKFNTAKPKAVVNDVKRNNSNVVKASSYWVWKPKHKVSDHVSKHNNASITLKKFDYVDAQGRSKFIQTFLDKQLDGLPTHKEKYDVSFHNKKVFANMKRIGKGFFGKETPLFPTMVGPNQVQMGEGSAQPTDTQHTPTFDMPPPKPKKTQKPRQPKRKTTKVPQPSESTDIAADESFCKEGEEVVEIVTTAKMIIDTVFDAAHVTTAIADVPVSAAETIVTIALTTTAESTKTNVKESTKKDKAETVQENISKRAGDELDQERSKKQKVEADKESEELQKCLEIIPNDGDEVTIDATPLSFKSPTIVDYKIYKERKKKYFQIFKADGNSQMYLTFSKLLKNFDREDLEVLWSLVKDRFLKTKPVDDMYSFILHTLKIMFEHRVEDNV
nr:hypothetical protein [Tanacetum cinerariifolium]